MADTAARVDELMERASLKLVATEYLACERLCLEAVKLARAAGDFERLARIMLPLQEARRQRRQIAEDAGTFLIAGPDKRDADAILDEHPRGCLLLADPSYQPADADALNRRARERGCMIEAMCPDQQELTAVFCDAMQRRGDAAVAAATAKRTGPALVDALLAELDRIGDHEIAHQRLAAAARQAANQ